MAPRANAFELAAVSPSLCVALIVVADIVGAAAGPLAGAVVDATVVLLFINVCVLLDDGPRSHVPLLLSVVALSQLIAFALPGQDLDRTARDALAAVLLLGALAVASRYVRFERRLLDISPNGLAAQLAIAAGGLPVGIAGEQLLSPRPLADPHQLAAFVVAIAVAGGLSAPAVELAFRWQMQTELVTRCRRTGPVLLNVMFASLYLGTHNAGYVALMGVAGLGLSQAVKRTGTIWGAVAAHSLISVGVLVVWPTVLR